MKNATELRTLVMENALTLGRLDRETLGKQDYATLTVLYRNALDALTEWAGLDYAHKSNKQSADPSFAAVKAILELYATDEDKIVIDQASMRTMRDCATKPKRLYSEAYTKAEKARKAQAKTVLERYNDLITLGAPERNEEEAIEDYVARVREDGIETQVGAVDMLDMFVNASAILVVKEKAVKDIKEAGNWTWRRPVAVDLNTFADLIENYIADCLMDGYNIKSSKTVRDEKAEARKQAKAEKAEAEKTEEVAA
jgi:hypothetical protein